MWKYIQLNRHSSPMAEIVSRCSSKSNLRLVIYHLGENHVECATVSPNEVRMLALSNEVAREIARCARNGEHAILAYDKGTNEVYLIDDTPKLEVASAVLLCVVAELLNGNVIARGNECGCGAPKMMEDEKELAQRAATPRDERGRFVPRFAEQANVGSVPCTDGDGADTVLIRRFHLGRH